MATYGLGPMISGWSWILTKTKGRWWEPTNTTHYQAGEPTIRIARLEAKAGRKGPTKVRGKPQKEECHEDTRTNRSS